jgi:nucleoside 2-deoxyribosyltransferase
MKTVYIAGPITGRPDYKRDFNRAENELIIEGYTVLNPAKLPQGMTPAQYMRICLAMIDDADAVLLLPNWAESQGARLEADYCRYTGKPAYFTVEGLMKGGGLNANT